MVEKFYAQSKKLDNVCYDIRGPVMDEAQRMESLGSKILKLNIGNPAPFGFAAPDEVTLDLIYNLRSCEGYSDSRGLFSARKAIMQYCQLKHIPNVGIDDIFTGNGVSELITMSMQGLLDSGDEILVPSPDYPLWTAAVNLAGGTAVHYLCDEKSDWCPDIEDMRSKVTDRTKGIVVINPNNPTGALYPKAVLEQIVEIAREHSLILFADEIYDRLVMDGEEHIAIASLAPDLLTLCFNGLSKSHRVAGYRCGWVCLAGDKSHAKGYIAGLNMLARMRLCSNVPAQSIIQTSLGGYQSAADQLTLETAKMIREDFLQQNAFMEGDQYSSFERQANLLGIILSYNDLCAAALEKGADAQKLFDITVRERIGRAKTVADSEYKEVYADIVKEMTSQIEEAAKESED